MIYGKMKDSNSGTRMTAYQISSTIKMNPQQKQKTTLFDFLMEIIQPILYPFWTYRKKPCNFITNTQGEDYENKYS
jgi:hypothetical protein